MDKATSTGPAVGLRAVYAALFACAAIELAVAMWDAIAGGFYFNVAGLRISSWEMYKPFTIGMVSMAAALWLHDRGASARATSWNRLSSAAPWLVGAVTFTSIAIAIRFGVFVAAGSDPYGYVSQAYMLASGRLTMDDRFAAAAPEFGRAAAPLGYQLARTPGVLAPIYPPGLPLMMAAAAKVGGPPGVYFVVPLLAGLSVWLTYALARHVADARTALVAAVAVAFSPIFVFQSFEPMSDVPATACWLAAWVFATSDEPRAPFASGLAVSAAILTRPNLVPLTLVLLLMIVRTPPFTRRLALFAAGAVPGCLIIAALNQYLYGSPVLPGYGPLGTLYAWNRFPENLRRYLSWLIELHTPGILLGLAAPFVGRGRATLSMLAFSGVLLLCYLFYFVFPVWPFLRFLLPAIPLLFILSSEVVMRLLEHLPLSVRGAAVSLLCMLVPFWYLNKARDLSAFAIHRTDYRYVTVGEEVGRTLEPHAVVFTVIESGSVRFYGNRPTVRWDFVQPDAFDVAVGRLKAAGYVPYLLLEDWEEQPFKLRFADASVYGKVEWPPAIMYRGGPLVRIYALADRARHMAGEEIVTRQISSER